MIILGQFAISAGLKCLITIMQNGGDGEAYMVQYSKFLA
jgi:hypothetical protein